jgi:hypothetical protein
LKQSRFNSKISVCSLDNINDQSGGGREVFRFRYDGENYDIGVVTTDGTDDDDNEFNVYFLSVVEAIPISRKCGFVKVYKDSNVGIVMDLNNYYPCITPDVSHRGAVVISAIIDYCCKNKAKLAIAKLQLEDDAQYQCPTTRSRINLLISNQLFGKSPYYSKFGFIPSLDSAKSKIRDNLSRISGLTVENSNLSTLIKDVMDELPSEIGQLLIEGKMSVSSVLKQISEVNCDIYSEIYQELFVKLRLKLMKGDETLFELMLDKCG